jgi:hypothetical protein
MSEPERPTAILAEPTRRLHRFLLDGLLATGEAPAMEVLAAQVELPPTEVAARLRELAAGDYLCLDEAGQVGCLYPLSPGPTSHVVVIDGQRRFAMCAIDLLGIPAMLGRALDLEARCAACGRAIELRVRPGAVIAADPPNALVVARRDEAAPAFAACCPFTLFACEPGHAEHLAERIAGATVLTLDAALSHAEEIFGDLLAPTLPAARRRGRRWG